MKKIRKKRAIRAMKNLNNIYTRSELREIMAKAFSAAQASREAESWPPSLRADVSTLQSHLLSMT